MPSLFIVISRHQQAAWPLVNSISASTRDNVRAQREQRENIAYQPRRMGDMLSAKSILDIHVQRKRWHQAISCHVVALNRHRHPLSAKRGNIARTVAVACAVEENIEESVYRAFCCIALCANSSLRIAAHFPAAPLCLLLSHSLLTAHKRQHSSSLSSPGASVGAMAAALHYHPPHTGGTFANAALTAPA